MAISFPPSPQADGTTYIYNGVTYVYNLTTDQWIVQGTGSSELYVLKTGDTMTGKLTGTTADFSGNVETKDLTSADATVDTLTSNGLVTAPFVTTATTETGGSASSGSGKVVGYQQGTWNCVLNGSSSGDTTITAGQFVWSRIGNQVFIDFQMAGGNKTTSGDVKLQNLPYTASSVCNQYTGFIGDRQGITYGATYDDIYLRINGGAGTESSIQVMQKNANDHGQLNNGGGNLTSSFVMRGHISYLTSNTDWNPINGATLT